ncbi:hypothetical protein ACKVWC_004241 [Pyricularia oryzae]|nr:hypothetical protein M9X92_009570 [Pyricularia oryzae]KAI7924797.1 hypothetical protein M0657_004420 [Pyricularia oryzae]
MPRNAVPDAWDDDWEPEAAASKTPSTQILRSTGSSPDGGVPLTTAERIARHEESNRRLWQSADAPEDLQPHQYLPATNNVTPVVFKPAMKVLSRRPGNTPIDDSERLATTTQQPTQEQMRLQREEKQRRYNEARAKIFGEPSTSPSAANLTGATNSGASTPGTVTPPLSDGGAGVASARHRRRGSRGNGRGRGDGGGRGGGGMSNNHNFSGQGQINNSNSNLNSDAQVRRPPPNRELYDPNSSPKPRRGGGSDVAASPRSGTPRENDLGPRIQAVRAPKGPDGTGRGGFGFSTRSG